MVAASPASQGARRWRAAALVAAGLATVGPARADDPDDPRAAFGLPTRPAPTGPRDLFGFDRKPTAPPPSCREATVVPCPRRDGAAPAAIETYLTRAYLRRLPTADADLGAVAGLTLGSTRDAAGLAWSGASSLDNRWLLDGAPIDSPRYGELGAVIPIDFLAGVRVRTAGFGAGDRAAVGATIDAELREGGAAHAGAARAWLGAGRSPSRSPRARGEYEPFDARYAAYRGLSAVGVVDGPLGRFAGGQAWYLAGIAPGLSEQGLERRGFRRADGDGDGVPDRDGDGAVVHEALADQHRDGLGFSVPILARAGLRTDHHRFALTALGHVGRTTRWLGIAEASAAGVDQRARAIDLTATWRGRWGATEARLVTSWHRAGRREAPHLASGAAPAIGYGYIPAPAPGVGDASDRAIRLGCADGAADAYPQIANCPLLRGYYWTGGAGALTDVVQDRPAITADLEHRLGEHLLAVGVTGEDARVVVTQRYTGGTFRQQLGAAAFIDYRLVRLGVGPDFTDDCGGAACDFLDEAATTYRTRYAAAYVTDTWRPDDTVAVEYGVRAQSTQVGTALVLRDVLPRIGASWDFLGRGRSRLFVGWGRYAQVLPTGTGERIFARPTILQTITLGGTSTALGGGGGVAVRSGAAGTRVDEAVVGVEVGVADVAVVGTSLRQRHLGRALEDEVGALGTAGAVGGVAATREFTEVSGWLANSPVARLGVRVGYAWSALRGNWPGPYDPVEGYTLSLSSLFDDGPGSGDDNATGALPNDAPHRFFAELALRGAWGGFAIDGGLRASAASGRPLDARIGSDQTFAIPRGSAGRLPTIATANLHLGARRGRLTVALDVYNLFDRRAVVAVDDRYASDARPVTGGDRSDLVWLKDELDDGPAHTNPGYGLPTRYQAPVAAVLGIAAEL